MMIKRRARWLLVCAAAGLAVGAVPADAADIFIESRTFMPARGIDGGETHVLLYEYLAVDTADAIGKGLYFKAGGWGRTDLADETFDQTTNSELQYAYLGWRAPVLNAEARAGRLSLTAGVARNEVFDGLLLGSDLPAGFDITVYGGVPVEVDENNRSQDALFGGRISQGRAGLYRLGVSYLQEQDAGTAMREEAGTDLFLAPVPLAQVAGTSLFNVIDNTWSRHDYRLDLGPFAQRVRLAATWVSTDYRHYFQSPKNPALEPVHDEQLDRIGGEVLVAIGGGFTLGGGYTAYQYDVSGDANAYNASLAWAGSVSSAGGSYRQVHGDSVRDRYWQVTGHAATALAPVRVSAGAERLEYEAPINGETSATTGSLSLSYAAGRSLELSATGAYGVTPEYDSEIEGMLSVLWHYDATTKQGGGK